VFGIPSSASNFSRAIVRIFTSGLLQRKGTLIYALDDYFAFDFTPFSFLALSFLRRDVDGNFVTLRRIAYSEIAILHDVGLRNLVVLFTIASNLLSALTRKPTMCRYR